MIKQYYITCDANCPSACSGAYLALSGQQATNLFAEAHLFCPHRGDPALQPNVVIVSTNELGGPTACTRDIEMLALLCSVEAAYCDRRAIDCQKSAAYNRLYETLEQLLARGEPTDMRFTGGAE